MVAKIFRYHVRMRQLKRGRIGTVCLYLADAQRDPGPIRTPDPAVATNHQQPPNLVKMFVRMKHLLWVSAHRATILADQTRSAVPWVIIAG